MSGPRTVLHIQTTEEGARHLKEAFACGDLKTIQGFAVLEVNVPERFDGKTLDAAKDTGRLNAQLERVQELMLDGKWRTLGELSEALGNASEASVSARLRDLRKEKFGSFTVNRRAREGAARGLFEYQLERPAPVGGLFGQLQARLPKTPLPSVMANSRPYTEKKK